jgi:hypothetical protein
VIDGVGPIYGQRLALAGVTTVAALAALDPDQVSLQMPRPKLWEAVAKAQLLMRSKIDPTAAAAVLDRRLVDVGSMTTAELSGLTGEPLARAADLRALVRRLQVALVDQVFGELTLREFVEP